MTEPFRPMRRFKQAASEDECIALLETAPRGVLSVLGDGGYPYGVPLNFIYENGKLYFHCAVEGHKLDALCSCGKASFCVLSEASRNPGEWWNCFTSVICFGYVREVTDQNEHERLLRALGKKYFPEGYDIDADMIKNAPRALVLELTIEHMTWKHVREK